ncbi:hypothetical protein [Soonwooa purpurea]
MKEKIENLRNIKSDFFLATNSFCFDLKTEDEILVLWINPIWRLYKNNVLINSSFECPIFQDYEIEKEYETDFKNWCENFNYLKSQIILNFKIADLDDIKLYFEDGSILETFKFDEDETWYLQNKEND